MTHRVDQILNDLETLVSVEPSERSFFQLLLHQLRGLLSCDFVARVQPIRENEWLVLNGAIDPHEQLHPEDLPGLLQAQLGRNFAWDGNSNAVQQWHDQEQLFIVLPIQVDSWGAGGFVVRFRESDSVKTASIVPILQAFCELSFAYLQRWHSKRWFDHAHELQTVLANVSQCDSHQKLYFTLANDLRVYLRADKIVVWRVESNSRLALAAVSDYASIPVEETLSPNFRKLAEVAQKSARAECVLEKVSEGKESRWLAFGLPSNKNLTNAVLFVAGCWEDETRFVDASYRLRSSIAVLDVVATNIHHQLSVPTWLRQACQRSSRSKPLLRAIGLMLGLVILTALSFWPISLQIQGRAFIEPKVKANVFAASDGIVETLWVEAGNKVIAGEKLLQIRSAELEVEIQKLEGELLALQEKRNGFRVSVNQMKEDDSEGQLARSQLSAEIIELDLREKQLGQMLELQRKKQAELLVCSPVAGVVITDNIREQLDQRPVKRGDRLLEVADINGVWHLQVEVPDRDAGHIRRAYSKDAEMPVVFRIVSNPDREYTGRLVRISDTIRMNRNNEPVWVLLVQFDQSEVPLIFGASVAVQFDCGAQPAWFVWGRPIWESLRRRFWL